MYGYSVTPAKVPEGCKKSARSRTGKSARKVKTEPLPDQTPITKDEKTNHVTSLYNLLPFYF